MIYRLDNIRKESHTYLYHLFTNYRMLAEVTIFVQGNVYNDEGSIPPHSTMGTREMRRRALDLKADEVFPPWRQETSLRGLERDDLGQVPSKCRMV